MDLDGDGYLDVLSGSYSCRDVDSAGAFHVLRGRPDGSFGKAEVVKGSNGQALILPSPGKLVRFLKELTGGDDGWVDRMCTRPFAADLNGDGKLDLVSGNIAGTFGFFAGAGGGKFAPKATWLMADGKKVQAPLHSDPFLVDWDKDGDLDLVSGSAMGGVFLFANVGSRTEPKFAAGVTLLAAPERAQDEPVRFGDAHCTAPGKYTRVWVDDVDGDGKLDLLVGDAVDLQHVAAGVSEADARTRLAAWKKEQEGLFAQLQGDDAASRRKRTEAWEQHQKKKAEFVVDESTGFVWLLLQK